MPKKEAIDIFKSYKMQDKVDLLHWVQEEYVNLYKLEDRYDYFMEIWHTLQEF